MSDVVASSNPPAPTYDPVPALTAELGLPAGSIRAVVRLLAEGATVPFIARYRKEQTGGLDEVQIRTIEERSTYLVELEARRQSVIAEIQSQGKLTAELREKILAAPTKAELEDLYLPYKPKRRTKATIAIERGLLPLAEAMWTQQSGALPEQAAQAFVNAAREVPDVAAALAGARDICAERLAEDADLRKHLREAYFEQGSIKVGKRMELEGKPTKFDMYANYEEPVAKVPSHRFLAIRRGESEDVLYARVLLDFEPHMPYIESRIPIAQGSPWQGELKRVAAEAVERHLATQVAAQVRVELKLRSDQEAINVFAQNLRELLLSAPFGSQPVLGIDPGQRTGCKCAVVDATGRLLEHDTFYLVQGDQALARAKEMVRRLCKAHSVRAVAVGNGTHGRETEAFVRGVLADEGLSSSVFCVSVSESGASVYSASDIAREEFPDLDLTVRGAVSIARRLQDPLAELVKVDPKSIGVGQYQHDVPQTDLGKKLDEVVESCVNQVGVELNTASAQLLARVAGIGPSLAKRIVLHRNENGPFASRNALLGVSGVGPKTFEQAAGFLRITGARHPLDASAVHPERYALVERMAADLGVPLSAVIGSSALLRRVDLSRYKSGDVGEFTLKDILTELDKPGRDPRRSFEPPKFRDDVREIQDLKQDMQLEGVVTNITAFGAFVDIGVHQDGLVHISELSDRFVKDPHTIVKVGDRLSVRVLSVDLERKRISLSAKRTPSKEARNEPGRPDSARPDSARPDSARHGSSRKDAAQRPARDAKGPPRKQNSAPRPQEKFQNNPFAGLLKKM
ncbi:MAG TPA: Tex family protein [Polyangiaceae bacterium]|nr:Tex family protein [Polyangiaceae bacterium]